MKRVEACGLRVHHFEGGTWIQPEEAAGPNNTFTRIGRAMREDGRIVSVRARVADTYFSIPARSNGARGYLTIDSGVLVFHASAEGIANGDGPEGGAE